MPYKSHKPTKETKEKIRQSLLGYKHTDETRKKDSLRMMGNKNGLGKKYKVSEETRRRLSARMMGNTPWNKGLHLSAVKYPPLVESGQRAEVAQRKKKPVSEETRKKLVEHHRPNHHSEETKKRISMAKMGARNASWQGGISFIPYTLDWTETLKRSIRERDNYVCRVCGKLQGEKAFAVHHIDYDKKNCNVSNLITLCDSCHQKTNSNRDFWQGYFETDRP